MVEPYLQNHGSTMVFLVVFFEFPTNVDLYIFLLSSFFVKLIINFIRMVQCMKYEQT